MQSRPKRSMAAVDGLGVQDADEARSRNLEQNETSPASYQYWSSFLWARIDAAATKGCQSAGTRRLSRHRQDWRWSSLYCPSSWRTGPLTGEGSALMGPGFVAEVVVQSASGGGGVVFVVGKREKRAGSTMKMRLVRSLQSTQQQPRWKAP
jgi:hypothetical protein